MAAREKELFALPESIYLYDLTSTYFEGKALRNEKAKRGYSRDQQRWEHEQEFAAEVGWEEIVRQPSPTNPCQKKTQVFLKQCLVGSTRACGRLGTMASRKHTKSSMGIAMIAPRSRTC